MAEKALEQALNLTPGDTERRFKLAYMYSEQGQKLLSLFHYQLLVSRDPTYPYAMNNLGVLYGDLNLPGKKIQTWKNATQNKDETFPIGNIAIAMIENGFYDEARNLLDTVPTERKTDKRIAAAIDLLSSKPGKEDAELEGLAGSMEVRHRYMLKAVESEQDGDLSKCTADAFLGLWKTPDGKELDFEVSDKGDLSATMKHPPTQGQVTSVFHRDQYFRQEFNLYIQRSGLVLSGSAVPSNRPPTFSLLSGSPASESFFMVLTGFNTLEGCFWSDDKYLKEVMFDRT